MQGVAFHGSPRPARGAGQRRSMSSTSAAPLSVGTCITSFRTTASVACLLLRDIGEGADPAVGYAQRKTTRRGPSSAPRAAAPTGVRTFPFLGSGLAPMRGPQNRCKPGRRRWSVWNLRHRGRRSRSKALSACTGTRTRAMPRRSSTSATSPNHEENGRARDVLQLRGVNHGFDHYSRFDSTPDHRRLRDDSPAPLLPRLHLDRHDRRGRHGAGNP